MGDLSHWNFEFDSLTLTLSFSYQSPFLLFRLIETGLKALCTPTRKRYLCCVHMGALVISKSLCQVLPYNAVFYSPKPLTNEILADSFLYFFSFQLNAQEPFLCTTPDVSAVVFCSWLKMYPVINEGVLPSNDSMYWIPVAFHVFLNDDETNGLPPNHLKHN